MWVTSQSRIIGTKIHFKKVKENWNWVCVIAPTSCNDIFVKWSWSTCLALTLGHGIHVISPFDLKDKILKRNEMLNNRRYFDYQLFECFKFFLAETLIKWNVNIHVYIFLFVISISECSNYIFGSLFFCIVGGDFPATSRSSSAPSSGRRRPGGISLEPGSRSRQPDR